MQKLHFLPPPGWAKPRLYHLLSPIVALVLVWLLNEYTPLIRTIENLTVDFRFKARAPFDPHPDPRLVFVGIDEPSLRFLGRWPWPRNVEADFLRTIANTGIQPRAIAFDLMFTEDTNKLDAAAANSSTDADKYLGESTGLLPGVITGAFRISDKPDKDAKGSTEPLRDTVRETIEHQTLARLSDPGPTQPLTNIVGGIDTLKGSDIADLPVDPIRKNSLFAFVNDEPAAGDPIRRTAPVVIRVRDKVYPSLALQTLCQLLNVDPDKVRIDIPHRNVTLTNFTGKTWRIPVNENGEIAINYRREKNFNQIGFYAALKGFQQLKPGDPIPPGIDFKDKALVIGGSATGIDTGPTPLSSLTALPLVHLNVINNVLNDDYITFVPWYWVVFGWAVFTWPTLLRLKDAPLGEAIFVPIAIEIAYIFTAFAIFAWWSIQIDVAWPVISYLALNFGGIVLRWREERQGRQQIKSIFSRMVSAEIMNHILDHPESMKLGGVDRASTVLFSDMRDFTKFSEGLKAEQVMDQINEYFERMVACVTERKGTLHKFIGDAIMAAWGEIEAVSLGPVPDAQNAVRAALLMRKRLVELNAERKERGLTSIRIGVGLNHGVVQAGMLGASGRMEFTVMGDAVNVASRLEGMTKEFKTDLAVSQSVRDLIGDEFLVRRLGLIVLKGKTEGIFVYEVIGEKSDGDGLRMTVDGVGRYEQAFAHFLSRRFTEAVEVFSACEKDYPDDHCTKTYLKASREFATEAPPPEWDGRIVMETK